jgi:hypothetical protein
MFHIVMRDLEDRDGGLSGEAFRYLIISNN